MVLTYFSGALIAGVPPQYYGVAAPWGVYPAGLLPQNAAAAAAQPRRPLTPSQQQDQVRYFPNLFHIMFSTK